MSVLESMLLTVCIVLVVGELINYGNWRKK